MRDRMPGMKDSALLITGDDFGVSHQVNEAIEAQYLAGRLTQTSLMIHGEAVEEDRCGSPVGIRSWGWDYTLPWLKGAVREERF